VSFAAIADSVRLSASKSADGPHPFIRCSGPLPTLIRDGSGGLDRNLME